jgi:hypothetical protein
MQDLFTIQSSAVALIQASTGISTCSVIADNGYSNTEIERALRDDGFAIVVRMPSGVDVLEQTAGIQFGAAPLIVHVMENAQRNPQSAGLQLNMMQVLQAVTAALQAVDGDGVRMFRVTGCGMVSAEDGLLVYEVTAQAPVTGL